jgi:hypothetical protein
MINYINLDLLEEFSNIEFKNEKLKLEKIINIDCEINYASFIEINKTNFIYYRNTIDNQNRIEGEQTERYILKNDLTIEKDQKYILKLGIANHNFRLFLLNNILFGIGGQALGNKNYQTFEKNIIINKSCSNKKFIDYHINKSAKFLDNKKYNIGNKSGTSIFSPNDICPYFANGLHLFEFNNINENKYIIHNNSLPIISGIKNNRYDGHYGFCDNKNINKSKDGLSVFDSNTSILYNKNNSKYILFQRANIGLGIRNIQYCESLPNDLTKWSEWNLVNINPKKPYFKTNYYINNFFNIDYVNQYIGILMYNKKINKTYYGLSNKGQLELLYSTNGIQWNSIGIIGDFDYHNEWIVTGGPFIKDNKHYYFIHNNLKKNIQLHYFLKDRYSYIENNKNEANIIFKKRIVKKIISINFILSEKGYLKFQLLDINKNIIPEYSFNNFNIIKGDYDCYDYNLKWNNNEIINLNQECFIQLIGSNFKIYSITF